MASDSFFSKLAAFFGFGKSSNGSGQHRDSGLPKLYVGNLAYDVSDEDLRVAFAAHGKIASATVVRDRYSNQSKGFGFVEMPSKSEANAAIRALNGQELKGRAINVSEARPRPEGASSGNGSGNGGGRGGYRRRGYRGRRGGRSSSQSNE